MFFSGGDAPVVYIKAVRRHWALKEIQIFLESQWTILYDLMKHIEASNSPISGSWICPWCSHAEPFILSYLFIFREGVGHSLRFSFFHMGVQLLQHYVLERPFSTELTLCFCKILIDHICVGLFLDSTFCLSSLYASTFTSITLS